MVKSVVPPGATVAAKGVSTLKPTGRVMSPSFSVDSPSLRIVNVRSIGVPSLAVPKSVKSSDVGVVSPWPVVRALAITVVTRCCRESETVSEQIAMDSTAQSSARGAWHARVGEDRWTSLAGLPAAASVGGVGSDGGVDGYEGGLTGKDSAADGLSAIAAIAAVSVED